jgi:hypothetical protein
MNEPVRYLRDLAERPAPLPHARRLPPPAVTANEPVAPQVTETPRITKATHTAEFYAWRNIRRKCSTPTDPNYRYCGLLGIKVCPQWLGPDGFQIFVRDLGPRPSADFALLRREKRGDFTPKNCFWGPKADMRVGIRKDPTGILLPRHIPLMAMRGALVVTERNNKVIVENIQPLYPAEAEDLALQLIRFVDEMRRRRAKYDARKGTSKQP